MKTTATDMMSFDTQVQTRMAFSTRREQLLNNWAAAPADGREFWAKYIRDINDAQAALGLGVW